MTPNASQLSAMTRLFSASVFREMAKKGRSPQFRRLFDEAALRGSCATGATVGSAFETAFSILKIAGRRHEYIYRTAVTQKILLGRHTLHTAAMLNEFRAGTCKADLVILNGTATVYEIKSERDSLTRLARQVDNYKRVFAAVNVIASEDHVEGVLAAVPEDIGVMCLSKRYRISVIQDAVNQPERVSPQTVFDSLRSDEAELILNGLGVCVPKVPNTQRHAVMRDLFAELNSADVHSQMVQVLKRSRNLTPLSDLIDQLPRSLHAAALSIPIRRADHRRLTDVVAMPLGVAMTWE
ncbi:hypothetical protein J2S22_000467 [Rhodoplanes tepidamans]|nr:hypothetical protein [Rhodoplanes tepidamans]